MSNLDLTDGISIFCTHLSKILRKIKVQTGEDRDS